MKSDAEVWSHITRERIDALRSSASGPIYLCGGGQFAGRLPEMGEIDLLCLKRAPILLGSGKALFAHAQGVVLQIEAEKIYAGGYMLREYSLT